MQEAKVYTFWLARVFSPFEPADQKQFPAPFFARETLGTGDRLDVHNVHWRRRLAELPERREPARPLTPALDRHTMLVCNTHKAGDGAQVKSPAALTTTRPLGARSWLRFSYHTDRKLPTAQLGSKKLWRLQARKKPPAALSLHS